VLGLALFKALLQGAELGDGALQAGLLAGGRLGERVYVGGQDAHLLHSRFLSAALASHAGQPLLELLQASFALLLFAKLVGHLLQAALQLGDLEASLAETELRTLEAARGASKPVEREIGELQTQITEQQQEVAKQQELADTSQAAVDAARQGLPDLQAAEREMLNLQEQENGMRMELGQAQQRVAVLDTLRQRQQELEASRETLAAQASQFEALERAFGKDGVPAMLIEQALPQIQAKANEVLERLSNGEMSISFVTQQEYKDRRREDKRETLEIQIRDSAGLREYEMFSGGEAFRINFAIRLALSEVLAQRAGARLQTLVIDEGFASQDEMGRQRLVEVINLVKEDFAKILVITHVESLKDAFPSRIEVEKGPRGSQVRII